MAGALFARIKTWVAETLNFADLNAEIQNILDKFTPSFMDDYSATVAEMKLTTDPGATGTESQATTLAGEIERLRFVIDRILGADATNWYDAASIDLTEANDLISAGNKIPANRLVSGRVRSATDAFPIVLVPKGSTNEATAKGASTSLTYRIAGTLYTLSADVDITGQSQAPSTNNTALVNDTALADGAETRTIGENKSVLTIDTVGSEISSRVGEYAAFKIAPGTDEYFYAFIESATTLTRIRRGFFFNSSDAPIKRQPIANNDTITLMRVAYVFITTTQTLASTLNLPKVQFDEPTGASNGDYWFDIANNIWKTFNGSDFVDSVSTYLGMTVTDDTNTVAARTEDIFAVYEDLNTTRLQKKSATQIESIDRSSQVSVAGIIYKFNPSELIWSMADHIDDGDIYTSGEQASTDYYFYLGENGDVHITDVEPYNRVSDLRGFYHPWHNWRFLIAANNDSSSDLVPPFPYPKNVEELILVHTGNGHGSTNVNIRRFTTVDTDTTDPNNPAITRASTAADGDSYTINKRGWYRVQYTDNSSITDHMGISLNSTELTTTVAAINHADRLTLKTQIGTALRYEGCEVTKIFNVGDVIRPHTSGSMNGATDVEMFQVALIKELRQQNNEEF